MEYNIQDSKYKKMETMISIIIIVLISVFFIIALIFTLIVIIIRKLKKRKVQKLQKQFASDSIQDQISNANFFGLESEGYTQIRGNGILILTQKEIYFQMWYPKKEIIIPFSSIISLEISRSHLGKTRMFPLIRVNFYNKNQQKDSVAWLVPNAYERKEKWEKIISGS